MNIDLLMAEAKDHLAWRENVKGDRPMEEPMRADAGAVLELTTLAKRYRLLLDLLLCSDEGESFMRVIVGTPFEGETPTPGEIESRLDIELARRSAERLAGHLPIAGAEA